MSEQNNEGLALISHSGIPYALEKVGAVTGVGISDRAMAEAGLEVLTKAVDALRDHLNSEGLAGDDVSDNARYILSRVRDYLEDSVGQPAAGDLEIMTRAALRHEVRNLQLVAEDAQG